MHSYVQSCSFQLPMWMVLEAGSIDDAELSSEFGHFSVQLPLSDLNLKPRAAVRARPIPLRNDPSVVIPSRTAHPASHLKLGSRRPESQNSRHMTLSSP